MTAVADKYHEFAALNAEVLAISIDSEHTHKAWHDNELAFMIESEDGIPYPMLADLSGKIGQLYGVYDEERRRDIRGRFIIDPDGVIQALEILNTNVGRKVNEIIRQIKAFQHARETGEATPADWEPGDTTLQPGVELIGKVKDVWAVGD